MRTETGSATGANALRTVMESQIKVVGIVHWIGMLKSFDRRARDIRKGERGMKTGIERIAAERQRQIGAEGWTPEHDAQHDGGELADAAACYAITSAAISRGAPLQDVRDFPIEPLAEIPWPFETSWWKPSSDPIRNLEKAGALIAAEIDRLLRRAGRESNG